MKSPWLIVDFVRAYWELFLPTSSCRERYSRKFVRNFGEKIYANLPNTFWNGMVFTLSGCIFAIMKIVSAGIKKCERQMERNSSTLQCCLCCKSVHMDSGWKNANMESISYIEIYYFPGSEDTKQTTKGCTLAGMTHIHGHHADEIHVQVVCGVMLVRWHLQLLPIMQAAR